MICEECKSCPIETLCDMADTIIDENLSLDGEHDILMAIYEKGRADAEAEQKAMCESCIHKVSADDIRAIRNSAIDEFVNFINTMPTYENEYGEIMPMPIEMMAEQLKESEK